MTKIGVLTHGTSGYILPTPDFTIAHDGANGVMIECPAHYPDIDVLDWITKERGGHWVMVIWNTTIKNETITHANPHMNNRGLWVYLVRKV